MFYYTLVLCQFSFFGPSTLTGQDCFRTDDSEGAVSDRSTYVIQTLQDGSDVHARHGTTGDDAIADTQISRVTHTQQIRVHRY